MTAQERSTQLRVGIFVAIGLCAVALMVVYFGRFGDSIRNYYSIRVEYPNASGIYKGASVLLAGAKIGMVENNPIILPDMDGVYVNLKIYEEVEIPSASEFTVGSSGLLGDRFVQIILKKDAESSPPIPPGTTIKGLGESGGLSEIDKQAPAILAEIKQAVTNINRIAEKLNNEVLKESTIESLNATLANLKDTSASFSDASKKVDDVVKKAGGAIDTSEQTMHSVKGAADELKKTLADIRGLVQQAKQGKGALGVLLADREMADNLRTLVINLRRHGILWYKDKGQPADSSGSVPMEAHRARPAPARAGSEAFLSAGIGGCIDALGVLTLGGLFVAHMSGNSAALGAAFGQGGWRTGLPPLFAVPVFVVGLFLGYVGIAGAPTYRRCAVILLAEAVLLSLFALVIAWRGEPVRNTASYFLTAALPILAMGLQNATLREVGRSTFPTTYITGVLDAMGKAAALGFLNRRAGKWGPEFANARRAGCVWLAYAAGALGGSAGLLWLGYGILAVPILALFALAGRYLASSGLIGQQPSAPGP